jgi:hypothetical protein
MEKGDSRICYEQYWSHARHVEKELLTFCSFYAVIIGAALIFLKTDEFSENLPIILFICILSIFGFFFNYNLRLPFIKFILKAELIAIKEFGLNSEYRRFFDSKGKLFVDKYIDTYDVIALFFVLVISLCSYIIFCNTYYAFLCIPFLGFHIIHRIKLDRIKRTIQNDLLETKE